MFLKLLLLFVAIPLVELFLLLVISEYFLGALATIGLVLVTGFVGAWLAQWQGTRAFGRIRTDLASGKMPTDAVIDAVLIFIAGAFLMTPGILTDAAGFGLLIPGGRKVVKSYFSRWFQRHFKVESFQANLAGDSDVIDSYTVQTEEPESSEEPPDPTESISHG